MKKECGFLKSVTLYKGMSSCAFGTDGSGGDSLYMKRIGLWHAVEQDPFLRMREPGILYKKIKVMLVAIGVGYSWAAMVIDPSNLTKKKNNV